MLPTSTMLKSSGSRDSVSSGLDYRSSLQKELDEEKQRGGHFQKNTSASVSLSNWKKDGHTRCVHHLPLAIFLLLLIWFILSFFLARTKVMHSLGWYIPAFGFVLYMLIWLALAAIYSFGTTDKLICTCEKFELLENQRKELENNKSRSEETLAQADRGTSAVNNKPTTTRTASNNNKLLTVKKERLSVALSSREEDIFSANTIYKTPPDGVLHFLIIPNYKEDEQMLSETIDAAAMSKEYAAKSVVLVLAMEARAGKQDEAKAYRLARKHANQYLDVLINFHKPGELPREIAGKSSNQQSAYLKVLEMLDKQKAQYATSMNPFSYSEKNNLSSRAGAGGGFFPPGGSTTATTFASPSFQKISHKGIRFLEEFVLDRNEQAYEHGEDAVREAAEQMQNRKQFTAKNPDVKIYDISRTFVTILDADSILHHGYFPLLTATALRLQPQCRTWRIYQSAVFPFRNVQKLPGFVRTSSYSHYVVECGLWNHLGGLHMNHSSYTMPLALLQRVNGWDADVIAEDHHMFLKCFCESHWTDVRERERKEKVNLRSSSSSAGTSGAQEQRREDGDVINYEPERKPLLANSDGEVKYDYDNAPRTSRQETTSRVKLVRIPLPTIGYTVEAAEDETSAHVWARYHQCVRHYYFVSELSYCFLQHIKLAKAGALSCAAHWELFRIEWHMITMLIFTPLYAVLMILVIANVLWCFFDLLASNHWTWDSMILLYIFSPVTIYVRGEAPTANAGVAPPPAYGSSSLLFYRDPSADYIWTIFAFFLSLGSVWLGLGILPAASVRRALKATLEGKFIPVYYLQEAKDAEKKRACFCCPTVNYEKKEYVKLVRNDHGNLIGDEFAYVEEDGEGGTTSTAGTTSDVVEKTSPGVGAAAIIEKSASEHSQHSFISAKDHHMQHALVLKTRTMDKKSSYCLFRQISDDYSNWGLLGAFFFAVGPAFYVIFRLSCHGHTAEYVVAEKPATAGPVPLVRTSSIASLM
ncbi:unnamed protein product [Amoebophrya sp. A120]|nr:unnamed protein product [Amoebophrya sp. A120]|eukprot:GSA120T00020092001.1